MVLASFIAVIVVADHRIQNSLGFSWFICQIKRSGSRESPTHHQKGTGPKWAEGLRKFCFSIDILNLTQHS